MATLSIDIPDAVMPRVVDALCHNGGWTAESGMSKAQFAEAQVALYVTNITRNYEGTVAAQAAERTARQKAETEIVITNAERMPR